MFGGEMTELETGKVRLAHTFSSSTNAFRNFPTVTDTKVSWSSGPFYMT